MAFGTDPTPDGLANPPIDDLMKHADSKYALAIFAAKRARQINSYFTQLNEGLPELSQSAITQHQERIRRKARATALVGTSLYLCPLPQ